MFVLDEEGANKKTSGLEHLGVALLNLYNFAKSDKGSPAKAIAALLKLYGDVPSEKMAVESVHSFFRQHYSDQSIDDVFGPESDYDEGRAAGANFFRQSGLRRLPSVLVNGVMLDEVFSIFVGS